MNEACHKGILTNDKCVDSAVAELEANRPNYGDSKTFSVRRSGLQAGELKMFSNRKADLSPHLFIS